jgi:hypothetical protein
VAKSLLVPIVLGCAAVIFPRVVLFLVWLLGNEYLESALKSVLLLILGFVFMPLTTLAYAYAAHSWNGPTGISIVGWALVAVAALIDLGSLRGGHSSYRRRDEWA